MKTKLLTIAVALAAICGGAIQSADALSFVIGGGDRPYYDGPAYWDSGYRYVWVPGHVARDGHWVHGHYIREGTFVRERVNERHVVHIIP